MTEQKIDLKQIAETWRKRISAANSYYEEWAKTFKVCQNEEFYYGKQWMLHDKYEPLVINLVYSTIEVQLPSKVFQNPVFSIKPKPSKTDFNLEQSFENARLKQDVLNYFAQDPDFELASEVELAILDAFFRFGVIEVGYSADWIENPNAGMPIPLKEYDSMASDDEILKQPQKIPQHERIYIKRIPSDRFRVGGIDHQNINKCSWCGYWEFVRVSDIKSNENLKNTKDLGPGFSRSADFVKEALNNELDEMLKQGDITILWHLWDQRLRKKYLMVDEGNDILFEKSYKRLPVFPLKYSNKLRGFYPIPPVTNWLAPQREYNEAHEALRLHRRRFVRKYVARQGVFPEGELEKFTGGGDGTIIETTSPSLKEALTPVENPQVGTDITNSLSLSRADFNEVSGTATDQRGGVDRETATQASIIEKRATIRELRPREQIATWLNQIGKEILQLAKEKLSLPFWIKVALDSQQDFGEITKIQENWLQVVSDQDFDDEDFEVNVSVSSLSPVTNEEEKQKFIEFLSILMQFPMISMSPTLTREAAERVGYRNEKVIQEMQMMASYVQLGQLSQAKQAVQQIEGPGAVAQRTTEQMTPPDEEQIRNQLNNQLVQ